MKTKIFIIAILTCVTLSTTYAQMSHASNSVASVSNNVAAILAQEEFKREVTREFTVSANTNLAIDNKYGNIRVIEGVEDKIMFKIEITGKGRTQQLAKEYAESISFDFSQSGNKVSARTIFPNISCNNCGRTVHYTVVAPKSVAMSLVNKYGNIHLDNVAKPLDIDLKYGSITTKALDNVRIDLKYGDLNFLSCKEAEIDCKYSKVRIGEAETIRADSKYDEITIGTVSDFVLSTGYTDVKISKLNKRFSAKGFAYGHLNIAEVATAFEQIEVGAAYSDVELALDARHNFRASLQASYGDIRTGAVSIKSASNHGRNSERIEGIAGSNPNPSARVKISVSYGNLNFK